MIRVKKSTVAPKRLSTHGYSDDSVSEAIINDQSGKCYLCERKLGTDYEVEHLTSQKGDESLINEWDNLFVACGYCNRKKSNSFDQICNPSMSNLEIEIVQGIDFARGKASFFPQCQTTAISKTIELLSRIFNGRCKLRKLREKRFWDEFIRKMNNFQEAVNQFLEKQDNIDV
ncbi:HNH endonuclease [Fibrobacter sp. UWS1]|uniref:HNH endonuclease n=1 Tax=Fibrobacter sp. UWS1 TaxID=1896220 RepID=UPI000BC7DACD|nr:HNH endonuclease [Fibrobacter sp. UWS1]PBC67166.1 HNH endonuclease [Fibrobacter sp. UWS1]